VPSAGLTAGLRATTVAVTEDGGADTEITMGADVLPENGPLALKAAVTVCCPAANEAVLKLTLPLEFKPKVPRTELPS